MTDEYDIGFRDGIKFVIKQLHAAADQVEQPTRGTFRKDDREVMGIVRTGRPFYAAKLRELAAELERQISQ